MNRFFKLVLPLSSLAVAIVGSLGVVTVETGCSKTCSSDEESSCTNAFTTCTSEAAASADKAKCQSCIDTYCKCYDDCGNSCDRGKVSGQCG